MLARPHTAAEAELLALLLVVSKSYSLHQTTCIEGFAYNGPGLYHIDLFRCGSPNVLEGVVVGIHATHFSYLHRDKAWLTADTTNVMGLKCAMRQNCINEFTATVNAATETMLLIPKTITNFSSSGFRYITVIVVGVILMLVPLWSVLEIARLVLIPLVQTHLRAKHGDGCGALAQDYHTVFTCSLYRSRSIVMITLITQLLSWIIILPNSIIWTWSTSSETAKIRAYLSIVNEVWDIIVVLHESFVYAVTKGKYVNSLEIITISAIVSYSQCKVLFAVTNINKKVAFTNAFNEQIDNCLSTPAEVLRVVYKPMLTITLWSLLCVLGVLVLRFVAYKLYDAAMRWWNRRRQVVSSKSGAGATKMSVVSAVQLGGRSDHHPTSKLLGPVPVGSSEHTPSSTTEPYKHVPLEELLNVPIRALPRAKRHGDRVRDHQRGDQHARDVHPVAVLLRARGCDRPRHDALTSRLLLVPAAAHGLQVARDPRAVERVPDLADAAAAERGQARLPASEGDPAR